MVDQESRRMNQQRNQRNLRHPPPPLKKMINIIVVEAKIFLGFHIMLLSIHYHTINHRPKILRLKIPIAMKRQNLQNHSLKLHLCRRNALLRQKGFDKFRELIVLLEVCHLVIVLQFPRLVQMSFFEYLV